jgi:hypothetical protein
MGYRPGSEYETSSSSSSSSPGEAHGKGLRMLPYIWWWRSTSGETLHDPNLTSIRALLNPNSVTYLPLFLNFELSEGVLETYVLLCNGSVLLLEVGY